MSAIDLSSVSAVSVATFSGQQTLADLQAFSATQEFSDQFDAIQSIDTTYTIDDEFARRVLEEHPTGYEHFLELVDGYSSYLMNASLAFIGRTITLDEYNSLLQFDLARVTILFMKWRAFEADMHWNSLINTGLNYELRQVGYTPTPSQVRWSMAIQAYKRSNVPVDFVSQMGAVFTEEFCPDLSVPRPARPFHVVNGQLVPV